MEYGDNQEATAIRRYRQIPGEDPVEASSITDIVWDRTDGQIEVIEDFASFDSFVRIGSRNRIKSAIVKGGFLNNEVSGKLTASYNQQDNDNYSYEWDLRLNDTDELPYQSFSASAVLNFNQREYENVQFNGNPDIDEETGEFKVEYGRKNVNQSIYNLYGIMLSSVRKNYFGDELTDEFIDENIVEYNPEGDYPLAWYNDYSKTVYEESVFLHSSAGIDEIDDDEAEVRYYNLQGLQVTDPTNGVYIRRQGSKVSKVMINN